MKTKNYDGEKLKKLREKNKYTQQQVADYLGLDQSYVAKIESNERPIPLSKLQSLLSLYGCTMMDLSEGANNSSLPIVLAYRADHVGVEDLHSIAKIKKLALNMRMMEHLLEASGGRENHD